MTPPLLDGGGVRVAKKPSRAMGFSVRSQLTARKNDAALSVPNVRVTFSFAPFSDRARRGYEGGGQKHPLNCN